MDEKQVQDMITALEVIKEKNGKVTEKLDAIDIAGLEKAKSDVLALVEKDQERMQKQTALQDEVDTLTKRLAEIPTQSREGQEFKEYDDAFSGYLRSGKEVKEELVEALAERYSEKALFGATSDQKADFTKDMVTGSDPDGGFFMIPERDSSIERRVYETSPIRSVATVRTTTKDVFEKLTKISRGGGGVWVGEVTARPKTDTGQYALLKIPVHEMYANPAVTQKMLNDAGFDVAAEVTEEASLDFSLAENSAFVVGDGSQKPKGFLAYDNVSTPGAYEYGKVEQIVTAASVAIDKNDLLNFKSKLKDQFAQQAAWAMNRDTFYNKILALEDGENRPLFNYDLLRDGGQLILLGDPIVLMQDLPDVAANSLSIVLADWRRFYYIIDRFGIRVLRDPYTNKPYIMFYTTKRVGGSVVNFEAGKILKTKA